MQRLSNYEKRSLFRFLALYLGSVFLLLAIIGWLFFEHNAAMMRSAMKFEMLSEAHRIESILTRKMMQRQKGKEKEPLEKILRSIRSDKFKVGFFDAHYRPLYSEIEGMPGFRQPFYLGLQSCYSMIHCPLKEEGVAYIGLQETQLKGKIAALRRRIIGYLVLSFLFMAGVGYFLARLFMRPIREKIDALDRFIEDTTHELNTPVTAILMTIRQLRGIEEKKLLRLKASAQRLSTMYDTLAYGLGRQSGEEQKQQLDLAQILEERVEAMRPIALGSRLRIEHTAQSCRIEINPEALRRLVDNILSNAIKYSNPGGRIRVDLSGCRLLIEDEGIGIEAKQKEEILKRYRRANRERGGFGIGLSIVTRICRENGIGLSIDSEKGKGTRVMLDFRKLSLP